MLLQAFYSIRSERRLMERLAQGGGRNAEADFYGQRRSNGTHASTTDSDTRLYRSGKGKAASSDAG